AVGCARRHRRRTLCPAGWDHQPGRILSWKFDRDCDLGLGRRARDAVGSDRRRGPGQSRQDLVDRSSTRNLALRPRRLVCRDDPGHSARPRRPPAQCPLGPAARDGSASRRGVGMSTATAAVETLLYLNGVTVSFDGFKALNELSLIVEEGELRTIIGPNGAGKTTMMDVVTGKT